MDKKKDIEEELEEQLEQEEQDDEEELEEELEDEEYEDDEEELEDEEYEDDDEEDEEDVNDILVFIEEEIQHINDFLVNGGKHVIKVLETQEIEVVSSTEEKTGVLDKTIDNLLTQLKDMVEELKSKYIEN